MHKRMSPHGDFDHLGNSYSLVDKFKVDKVYLPSNVTKLSNLFCLPKSGSPELKVHAKAGSVTAENLKNTDIMQANMVVFE